MLLHVSIQEKREDHAQDIANEAYHWEFQAYVRYCQGIRRCHAQQAGADEEHHKSYFCRMAKISLNLPLTFGSAFFASARYLSSALKKPEICIEPPIRNVSRWTYRFNKYR